MLSRRSFLARSLSMAAGWLLTKPDLIFAARFPHFFFTQIRYKGGEWDPNPFYADPIVEELELRTSINGSAQRRIIEVSDAALFYSPFVYMAGRYEFEPFTLAEREILRRFLSSGGFLLAEDTVGAAGFGFDRSFRREIAQILPEYALARLAPDHSVYRSFYLTANSAGRLKANPYLEGVTIGNWTPVIYSQNDLTGAWSKDKYGKWMHACVPGGDAQRQEAFKMGINLIVYCLTGDYKKDLIHHPFIQRRRNP